MLKMRESESNIRTKMNLTELDFNLRISNKEMSFKMRTKEPKPSSKMRTKELEQRYKRNLMTKKLTITTFSPKPNIKWPPITKILEEV